MLIIIRLTLTYLVFQTYSSKMPNYAFQHAIVLPLVTCEFCKAFTMYCLTKLFSQLSDIKRLNEDLVRTHELDRRAIEELSATISVRSFLFL